MPKSAPDLHPAVAGLPAGTLGAQVPWLVFAALVAAGAFVLQNAVSDYALTLAALLCLNIALAVSLTLTNGLTGLFSLGHPAFMTIGAYISAVLTYPVARKSFMLQSLPEPFVSMQLPFLVGLAAAAAIAGIAAFLLGVVVLRLKGHYLAVATLGFIVIVQGLATNWQGLTRGGSGLNGIPRFTNLWWCGGLMFLSLLIVWRIKFSSLGRAMLAVRENQLAAECSGIRSARVKLVAFVLGAVIAAIAGAMTAHLITVVTPKSYGIGLAFNLVVMVVIGGAGSVSGAVLAAIAITAISEGMRPLEESLNFYGLSQVVVALALIVALLYRPAGLFGSGEPAWLKRLLR
jgi:branched-chain amino acid transport system permease protein